MKIAFTGHSSISSSDRIKELVKNEIKINIEGESSITCYLGGYGDFDELCACACRELKKDFNAIELVYVTPYISLSEQAKIQALLKSNLYDSSIYPPIEGVPPRFAISKRNEWMMLDADLIIAFVTHSYGGAYTSLQFARRKGKRTINIYDLLK